MGLGSLVDHLKRAAFVAAFIALGTVEAAAWCVRGVERGDTLRIRAAPTPYARPIGGMPPNSCGVAIVGACRGAWCPVAWRGQLGWSNSYFLVPPGLAGPPAQPAVPRTARLVVPKPVAARVVPSRTVASRSVATPSVAPRSVVSRARAAAARSEPTDTSPSQSSAPSPVQTLPPAPPPVAAVPISPPPSPAVAPLAAASPAGAAFAAPALKAPPAPAPSEVCVVEIAKGETLKVRAGPGADQSLRFGFPAGVCGVKVTGPCKDGWCPVDYRGYRGWAEQKHLK